MERLFKLLTRQFEKKFWATVWPYVRTDRVFGNRGRDMKIHFCPQNFAIWGTDRKFGTWPPSRARSTYYYYTTPGRTFQVFFKRKIKKNPTRVLILVGVLIFVATFPHGVKVVTLCVGVRHFAQARLSRLVLVVRTIPRVDRAMKMLFTSQGGYTPSPAIIARNSPKASMQAMPISISCFSP